MSSFLREIKRRRVLRTASLYVVGAWILLQVVEVLSATGLPPSTMRHLLLILSIGFPVALITGWFFDITKDGITKTGPLKKDERLPELKFIDHVLLVGLAFVAVTVIYILFFLPPEEHQVAAIAKGQQRTIAVLGFTDLEPADGSDPLGDVFAGELRGSLTRTAGLRVLGPETSNVLSNAGENRFTLANELLVTAMVVGEILLDGGRIQVDTRLIGVPAGNELWSGRIEGSVGDTVALLNGLVRQIVEVAAPGLDPDPVQGHRAEAGDCADVYDLYLRGKQLSKAHRSQGNRREKGVELLREAVAIDDRCALAWEAIAIEAVDWSFPGFVKAGAAARRALELNASLPEAWSVLAEIAEEEERWTDSEEYFLRALYADPTNARANEFYGEALLARGRVKEGLHHALEAYRYEPASGVINFHVSLAAKMAGDAGLLLKHTGIMADIVGRPTDFSQDHLAEGYLLQGKTERALEAYAEMEVGTEDWFLDCVRARDDPGKSAGLATAIGEIVAEKLPRGVDRNDSVNPYFGWQLIRCGTWIGEADLVLDLLLEGDIPTEQRFFALFFPDAGVLRQHPRFRKLMVESGLLEYWRKWGWSDYCEPDGDSFRCD